LFRKIASPDGGNMVERAVSGTLAAVLFDLDGTLIDSLPDLVAAVNRMLAAEARPPLAPDAVKGMVGDAAITLVERAFAATGGAPCADLSGHLARLLADYEPRSAETTRPWPGVTDVLGRLKARGLSLAVCTNKPARATAQVLGGLGLAQYFDLVLCADEVPAMKPDPRHVTLILDRLGIGPAQAVMVGDSYNDIEAARRAGLRSIALSFGYAAGPVAALGADRVIDDFAELEQALGLGGPAPELRALLPRFHREMAEDRLALAARHAAGDLAALARHAHAMRGKAMMFGALALAEPLERLESLAGRGGGADLAPLLDEIAGRIAAGDVFPSEC
jgi:phosphoglycolate phosphatase